MLGRACRGLVRKRGVGVRWERLRGLERWRGSVLGQRLSSKPKRKTSFERALARERGVRVKEDRGRGGGGKGGGKGGGAEEEGGKNVRYAMYTAAVGVLLLGASYAAVPLYQAFCRATGYGGQTQVASEESFRRVRPVEGARPITVHFAAQTSDSLPWTFTPLQESVRVVPGETALVFYRARNLSDKPVVGVSTYNVTPFAVGVHFEKIQCFCFEYQKLRPNEEVDMPIFFYIDPEFARDPAMVGLRQVTLSYTFFQCDQESEEAEKAVQDIQQWTQTMQQKVNLQEKPQEPERQ